MAKYVFVTGGVTSSLGKGITAASVGRLLKARGLAVSVLKLDPYINVDPGTMSPYQHGEVFVLDDFFFQAFGAFRVFVEKVDHPGLDFRNDPAAYFRVAEFVFCL